MNSENFVKLYSSKELTNLKNYIEQNNVINVIQCYCLPCYSEINDNYLLEFNLNLKYGKEMINFIYEPVLICDNEEFFNTVFQSGNMIEFKYNDITVDSIDLKTLLEIMEFESTTNKHIEYKHIEYKQFISLKFGVFTSGFVINHDNLNELKIVLKLKNKIINKNLKIVYKGIITNTDIKNSKETIKLLNNCFLQSSNKINNFIKKYDYEEINKEISNENNNTDILNFFTHINTIFNKNNVMTPDRVIETNQEMDKDKQDVTILEQSMENIRNLRDQETEMDTDKQDVKSFKYDYSDIEPYDPFIFNNGSCYSNLHDDKQNINNITNNEKESDVTKFLTPQNTRCKKTVYEHSNIKPQDPFILKSRFCHSNLHDNKQNINNIPNNEKESDEIYLLTPQNTRCDKNLDYIPLFEIDGDKYNKYTKINTYDYSSVEPYDPIIFKNKSHYSDLDNSYDNKQIINNISNNKTFIDNSFDKKVSLICDVINIINYNYYGTNTLLFLSNPLTKLYFYFKNHINYDKNLKLFDNVKLKLNGIILFESDEYLLKYNANSVNANSVNLYMFPFILKYNDNEKTNIDKFELIFDGLSDTINIDEIILYNYSKCLYCFDGSKVDIIKI